MKTTLYILSAVLFIMSLPLVITAFACPLGQAIPMCLLGIVGVGVSVSGAVAIHREQ